MIQYRLVVVTLVALPSLAEPSWIADREVDGMKIEYREVPPSPFHEYRVSTVSKLPLDRLCGAVWGKNAPASGDFKKRVVIKETDDERWTYEQVKVPLVTDRDCLMHVVLVAPAQSGRCEVKFETVADPAYPPDPAHVRVPAVRGSWKLEPLGDGQVAITYVVYSEPGGSVPAVFARGGQRDAALGFMKTILARALQQSPP